MTTVVQVAKCPFCQKRVVRPEVNIQAHLAQCRHARLALGEHLRTERRKAMIDTQTTSFTRR